MELPEKFTIWSEATLNVLIPPKKTAQRAKTLRPLLVQKGLAIFEQVFQSIRITELVKFLKELWARQNAQGTHFEEIEMGLMTKTKQKLEQVLMIILRNI